jgi:sodium-dependent dicarboxylate transporter 2/3/5
VLGFRKAFRRSAKAAAVALSTLAAHLVNQGVAHEVLALQLLSLTCHMIDWARVVASGVGVPFFAIVGGLAPGLGVKPETLVIPAVFAASWAFALPVGTPPNALVYASGHVRSRDMLRAGLVLDVVSIVVIVVMAKILL